jgi:hypothetical protein
MIFGYIDCGMIKWRKQERSKERRKEGSKEGRK